MLENADVRAAEVMRIADQLQTNSCISILEFKTYVRPVPKLRPFVEWVLQDRAAVFKKYDHDKSGAIDIKELELILDEYFNTVASEYDEFRGDYGTAGSTRPPPPALKEPTLEAVVLQWREWRGVQLLLECVKISDTAADEAAGKVQAVQGEAETEASTAFQVIYADAVPHCEVKLGRCIFTAQIWKLVSTN